MSLKTLQMVYLSYFHSAIKYGITFGCNLMNNLSVFKLQ
jgi:hypothetical protein